MNTYEVTTFNNIIFPARGVGSGLYCILISKDMRRQETCLL